MKIILLIIIGSFIWTPLAEAGKIRFLRPLYVGFEAWEIESLRDPFIPQYNTHNAVDHTKEWSHGAAFLVDMSLLQFTRNSQLYWENRVHMDMIPAHVKSVGWQFEVGLQLGRKLDLYYGHHSRHILDEPEPEWLRDFNKNNVFPVRDVYGFRFNLYGRRR